MQACLDVCEAVCSAYDRHLPPPPMLPPMAANGAGGGRYRHPWGGAPPPHQHQHQHQRQGLPHLPLLPPPIYGMLQQQSPPPLAHARGGGGSASLPPPDLPPVPREPPPAAAAAAAAAAGSQALPPPSYVSARILVPRCWGDRILGDLFLAALRKQSGVAVAYLQPTAMETTPVCVSGTPRY